MRCCAALHRRLVTSSTDIGVCSTGGGGSFHGPKVPLRDLQALCSCILAQVLCSLGLQPFGVPRRGVSPISDSGHGVAR